MDQQSFLNRIVDNWIQNRLPLDGTNEGVEACRNKTPAQILSLLIQASQDTASAPRDSERYKRMLNRECQIDWVMCCLSAFLHITGKRCRFHPSAAAYLIAARILGVEPSEVPSCLSSVQRRRYRDLAHARL